MAEKRVARVTEIIAASPVSFDDAVRTGFERANKTLRGVTGMRVKDHRISIYDGQIEEYRVKLEVIFILEN